MIHGKRKKTNLPLSKLMNEPSNDSSPISQSVPIINVPTGGFLSEFRNKMGLITQLSRIATDVVRAFEGGEESKGTLPGIRTSPHLQGPQYLV